jgi:hypothetical protein
MQPETENKPRKPTTGEREADNLALGTMKKG